MTHATYSVTSAPSTEPLTLTQLKERLRVTTTQFDDELEELLTTARRQVEQDTTRKLITQTVALYLDDFPAVETLEIRLSPISAVVITYTDTAGETQTVAATDYNLDTDSTPPRVRVVDGVFWPAVDDVPNAVTVTITAGYGAAADVPAEAKLAIVEWCKLHWGQCDGDRTKYRNLIESLSWSAIGRAA